MKVRRYPLFCSYTELLLIAMLFLVSVVLTHGNYANGQDGITAAFVGDISCSKNGRMTISSIKADDPDIFIVLGDMSYQSSVSCFYDYIHDLTNKGVTVRCNIGNHDSVEVMTDELERSYWNLCAGGASQEGFWKIQASDITLLGINTQCDGSINHTATYPPCGPERIIEFLKSIDKNRFVVATAHKPLCDTPKSKNSEFKCSKAMVNEFDRIGLTATVSGDNHCSAFKERKFIAGSGGRSHYACTGWDWIDDANYGYLFMKQKGDKLDFVFKRSKTRAELSPHFILDISENEKSLQISSDSFTRVLIQAVNGTVEFRDRNGTIYYQIPTAAGPAWIQTGNNETIE
jgi:hypothetical protein